MDRPVCHCHGRRMCPKTNASCSDSADRLTVRIRRSGHCAVLTPRGEIDHGSVRVLDRALESLLDDADSIVLNMAEVSFMDSAGLHFLHRLDCLGRRHGIPTAAVNWMNQPRLLWELVHAPPTPSAKASGLVA
ncbi:STAS domain-containing protein [Streptomyces sp. NPDC003077]|uniref:STAS domain-containing protein n=1 Tax=Streptomyces sp. NPDC003077 TaxID=3154443 RepID=UPI0033A4AC1C